MTPFLTESFAERGARERARALLDPASFRELLDPFARIASPYLAAQDVVPQADDGVVVARGTLGNRRACVVASDGRFLGGSIGEIGGAKIAGALELARRDFEDGRPTRVVLALDTGGIRLQEANLGILAVTEICDAIVALRERMPVVAVIAGRVGVYGGLSLSTALCSAIIVSEGARIGLNGPDVVETESGIEEMDSSDRPLIWRVTGGRRRFEQDFTTELVADDVGAIRAAVERAFERPRPLGPLVPPPFPDPRLERDAFLHAMEIQP
ncbi:MAG TPA: biotin-independent malonate decarboxylase subunit beta [Candidatus Baltobacteraceae bacterium]|nr:biotin-independent malonate decarboxylase subunit beta [Candidatus Baltobacteraceae bacterium]